MTAHYRAHARWNPLGHTHIRLAAEGHLWADRQATNRSISLQHGYDLLESAGNFDNLKLVTGQASGDYRGPLFMDSDLYKWLEAVGLELANQPDAQLEQLAESTIELLAAAQMDDGYLNSFYQVVKPDQRWQNLRDDHELYCAGHLIEAAVAYQQGTGHTNLLDIAVKFVDHIDSRFGPGKLPGTPGHPEIELALVKLYHATGEQRYLNLCQFFIDQRGQNILKGNGNANYFQDAVPVRDQTAVVGHAVRALYLTTGVTDVYMESGEQALLDAMLAQWHDMTTHKLSLTAGIGARHEGESFGAAHELPNDRAYNETCAAIASIFWNWRLLQVTGEGHFADLIERTLYNGFLSGVGLNGRGYFYVNPLASRGGYSRPDWHWCACCPPNVMRVLASVTEYFATFDASGIQVHQYAPSVIEHNGVRLKVETNYPWNGQVSLVVETTSGSSWVMQLRVPAWCENATLEINADKREVSSTLKGYVSIERVWQPGDRVTLNLIMTPRLMTAHPYIDATRGTVAIEYGPLVYCLEQIDQEVDVMDVELGENSVLETEWRPDLMGGTLVIKTTGYVVDHQQWQDTLYRPVTQVTAQRRPVRLTAVPYHLWANRDAGAMRVWIPYNA